jgi:polyhydroxyalkanoate synthase
MNGMGPEALERCRKAGEAMFDLLIENASKGRLVEKPMVAEVLEMQAAEAARLWSEIGRDAELADSLMDSLSSLVEEDDAGVRFRDRRYADEAWWHDRRYVALRRIYDRLADWIQQRAGREARDHNRSDQQALFMTRQIVEACNPANNLLINPSALRRMVETGGDSLAASLEHLVSNADFASGRLPAPMCPQGAFRLGEDIAITPGSVIAENRLCQLIHYPAAGKRTGIPVFIVPPWINKFYILDLKPENSLVRWLTEQGRDVFLLSWVNPGAEHADCDFEDYLTLGPVEMMHTARRLTGFADLHALGYCLGGTLLASAMAWMSSGREKLPSTVTLMTTLLDFTDPGDISAFVTEQVIDRLESRMRERGFLEGSEMSDVFALLRSRDLYWSFFIESYLLGKEPKPFDILHWNGDNTRMPAAMHVTYLRKLYLENCLVDPGSLMLAGRGIDLGNVSVPSYILATVDDHIAPWKSVLEGVGRISGDLRFVLGGSGHVAGVINHPSRKRYGYRVLERSDDQSFSAEAVEASEAYEGSWWDDWKVFLTSHDASFDKTDIREPEPLESAPGRYVRH